MSSDLTVEERTESRGEYEEERRAVQRAFSTSARRSTLNKWMDDVLDFDLLRDDEHHMNWHATYSTPVIRALLTSGGPQVQWEIGCDYNPLRRSLTARRAAFVYMPWFKWDTHHIRDNGETMHALQALAEYLSNVKDWNEELLEYYCNSDEGDADAEDEFQEQ